MIRHAVADPGIGGPGNPPPWRHQFFSDHRSHKPQTFIEVNMHSPQQTIQQGKQSSNNKLNVSEQLLLFCLSQLQAVQLRGVAKVAL